MQNCSRSINKDGIAILGWRRRWWDKYLKRSWWLPVIGAHGCDRYRSRVRSYDWARVCYDDLAGYLGVAVGEALKTRGFMILEAEGAQVTRRGMSFLSELGIKFDMLSKSRRAFCRPCLDWSERRYHVAGRLGAIFLNFCLERQWVERRADSRALQITSFGARQFKEVFQIENTR